MVNLLLPATKCVKPSALTAAHWRHVTDCLPCPPQTGVFVDYSSGQSSRVLAPERRPIFVNFHFNCPLDPRSSSPLTTIEIDIRDIFVAQEKCSFPFPLR
jgi:hypothetical protein